MKWRAVSAGLVDVLIGLLVAGVVTGALIAGAGLPGPGPATVIGLAVAASVAIGAQWLRHRRAGRRR